MENQGKTLLFIDEAKHAFGGLSAPTAEQQRRERMMMEARLASMDPGPVLMGIDLADCGSVAVNPGSAERIAAADAKRARKNARRVVLANDR